MGSSSQGVYGVARRQLDQRLEDIRTLTALQHTPKGGWVAALRKALGMTQANLAVRLGVSRQAVSQLEQREADGSVTLKSLAQVAEAFGGRLVYAIVPERSIHQILHDRALEIAKQMTGSIRHSMRLEDQEPLSDMDERTLQLANDLMESPERLWATRGDQ